SRCPGRRFTSDRRFFTPYSTVPALCFVRAPSGRFLCLQLLDASNEIPTGDISSLIHAASFLDLLIADALEPVRAITFFWDFRRRIYNRLLKDFLRFPDTGQPIWNLPFLRLAGRSAVLRRAVRKPIGSSFFLSGRGRAAKIRVSIVPARLQTFEPIGVVFFRVRGNIERHSFFRFYPGLTAIGAIGAY
ncbi:MAG: hypothetical protein V3V80_05420, partial [Dehalococcoidia bacterium]